MAIVFAVGFGVMRSAWKLAAVLFVANSAGYFLGAAIWAYAGGETGMLLWGVVYGLFLGAGLGAIIHLCQHR